MTLIGQLLQQAAPPSNEVPATIQAALGLLLLYAAREVSPVAKAMIAWVNGRTQERRTEMKSYEQQIQQQIEQNGKLFEEIGRNHVQLASYNQTMLDTQRLMTEQHTLFNQERAVWKEEMHKMTQAIELKQTMNEALAKENLELKAENERLRRENKRLSDELSRRDPDPATGSRVDFQDARLVPPDEPEDDAPSSSTLPGIPMN